MPTKTIRYVSKETEVWECDSCGEIYEKREDIKTCSCCRENDVCPYCRADKEEMFSTEEISSLALEYLKKKIDGKGYYFILDDICEDCGQCLSEIIEKLNETFAEKVFSVLEGFRMKGASKNEGEI